MEVCDGTMAAKTNMDWKNFHESALLIWSSFVWRQLFFQIQRQVTLKTFVSSHNTKTYRLLGLSHRHPTPILFCQQWIANKDLRRLDIVCFFCSRNQNIYVNFKTVSTALGRILSFLDTSAGPNSVREHSLSIARIHKIRHKPLLYIQDAKKRPLKLIGIFWLFFG